MKTAKNISYVNRVAEILPRRVGGQIKVEIRNYPTGMGCRGLSKGRGGVQAQ